MKREKGSSGETDNLKELSRAKIVSLVLLSFYQKILGVNIFYNPRFDQPLCQSVVLGDHASYDADTGLLTFTNHPTLREQPIHAFLEETTHCAHHVINPDLLTQDPSFETMSEKQQDLFSVSRRNMIEFTAQICSIYLLRHPEMHALFAHLFREEEERVAQYLNLMSQVQIETCQNIVSHAESEFPIYWKHLNYIEAFLYVMYFPEEEFSRLNLNVFLRLSEGELRELAQSLMPYYAQNRIAKHLSEREEMINNGFYKASRMGRV